MLPTNHVWVFNGAGSGRFPGGVFTTVENAERWIAKNKLTGVLTAYPVDQGSLDWALSNDCTGLSEAKLPSKRNDPAFVGSFFSAAQEHLHYEEGRRE
jgi:hypothetical protein